MCKTGKHGMFQGTQLFAYFFSNVRMRMPMQVHPPGGNRIEIFSAVFSVKVSSFSAYNPHRIRRCLYLSVWMPYVMAISFNQIHVSALQIQVDVLTAVHNNIASQWPPGIPGWWPPSLPIRRCLRSTIRFPVTAIEKRFQRSEEHT